MNLNGRHRSCSLIEAKRPFFIRFLLEAWLLLALVISMQSMITHAQVARAESINPLKKAIYTVDPSKCPQMISQHGSSGTYDFIVNGGFGSRHVEYYWYGFYALVPIPELTSTSLPVVQIWRRSPETPDGLWIAMPTWRTPQDWQDGWGEGSSMVAFTNGTLVILYKTESHPDGFPTGFFDPRTPPGLYGGNWKTNDICPPSSHPQGTNIYAITNLISVVYESDGTSTSFKVDAAVNSAGISLSLPTENGRTYAVEYTPVMPPTNEWTVLEKDIAGHGDPVLVKDTNRVDQRFYRALAQ
jgi:hypothetical protein